MTIHYIQIALHSNLYLEEEDILSIDLHLKPYMNYLLKYKINGHNQMRIGHLLDTQGANSNSTKQKKLTI